MKLIIRMKLIRLLDWQLRIQHPMPYFVLENVKLVLLNISAEVVPYLRMSSSMIIAATKEDMEHPR